MMQLVSRIKKLEEQLQIQEKLKEGKLSLTDVGKRYSNIRRLSNRRRRRPSRQSYS